MPAGPAVPTALGLLRGLRWALDGGRGWLAATARRLAESPLLARGKALWEKNQQDPNLPLSRLDNLRVGARLILKDYSQGLFPPTFTDRQTGASRPLRRLSRPIAGHQTCADPTDFPKGPPL